MINIKATKEKCKDDISKIENYEEAINDKVNMWECHHRLELTLDGEFAHTHKELKRLGMYWHRPYFELIFLTRSEHASVHRGTEEYKRKMSESMKGKNRTFTEEHKKNISKGKKGITHSEFGKKYFEHYGYSKSENTNQYDKERTWYRRHNKTCSWEIK